MTITSLATLESGLLQRFKLTKATVASQTTGTAGSYWAATGNPGVGSTGGTLAACEVLSNASVGAIPYINPTGGAKTHVSSIWAQTTTACSWEIHDRLLQASGIDSTNAASNQVFSDCDLLTQAGVSNIAERMGRSDYSSVQWWLEWVTTTGTTATTATVNVTHGDGTTANINVDFLASMAVGRMLPIISSNSNKPIRGVNYVRMVASTGTAGNIRVVATVQRCEVYMTNAGTVQQFDWAQLGLPVIYDSSCLFLIGIANGTTLQAPTLSVTLAQR